MDYTVIDRLNGCNVVQRTSDGKYGIEDTLDPTTPVQFRCRLLSTAQQIARELSAENDQIDARRASEAR